MKRLFFLFLFAAAVTLTPIAEARLDDDLETLEKRFGKGKPTEVNSHQDRGLWSLFDSVLRFEKSDIVIVAGLADGKCVAISYEAPPSKKGEALKGMTPTEVQTLLAKNAGQSLFAYRTGNGSILKYAREDGGAFMKAEQKFTSEQSWFVRATFYSSELFSNFEKFDDEEVSGKFLRAHPPEKLSDF